MTRRLKHSNDCTRLAADDDGVHARISFHCWLSHPPAKSAIQPFGYPVRHRLQVVAPRKRAGGARSTRERGLRSPRETQCPHLTSHNPPFYHSTILPCHGAVRQQHRHHPPTSLCSCGHTGQTAHRRAHTVICTTTHYRGGAVAQLVVSGSPVCVRLQWHARRAGTPVQSSAPADFYGTCSSTRYSVPRRLAACIAYCTWHICTPHTARSGPMCIRTIRSLRLPTRAFSFLRINCANASNDTESMWPRRAIIRTGRSGGKEGGAPPIDHITVREQVYLMPCMVSFATQVGRETKAHVAYPLICRARIKPPLLACPLRRRMERTWRRLASFEVSARRAEVPYLPMDLLT